MLLKRPCPVRHSSFFSASSISRLLPARSEISIDSFSKAGSTRTFICGGRAACRQQPAELFFEAGEKRMGLPLQPLSYRVRIFRAVELPKIEAPRFTFKSIMSCSISLKELTVPWTASARRMMLCRSSAIEPEKLLDQGQGEPVLHDKRLCLLLRPGGRNGRLQDILSRRKAEHRHHLVDFLHLESCREHFVDAQGLFNRVEGPCHVVVYRGEQRLPLADVQEHTGKLSDAQSPCRIEPLEAGHDDRMVPLGAGLRGQGRRIWLRRREGASSSKG